MKWLRPLYVGDGMKEETAEAVRAAERGLKSSYDNCRLLILPAAEQCSLDILSFREARKPYYRRKNLTVIGLAADRAEALALLVRIAEDSLSAGAETIKAFLDSIPEGRYVEGGEPQ